MRKQSRVPTLLISGLLLGIAWLRAGGAPASEAVVEEPAPAGFELRGNPVAGREEYGKKCAVCHGENGDGRGRIKIEPPPRDLGDADYMRTRTDWQIFLAIRDGGPAVGMSRQMIPWGGLLSEQEMHDVSAYVRSLSEDPAAANADGD